MELPEIEIAGRKIGTAYKPFIICELSANHNGSIYKALELIDAAADSGCDAVKLQTYTPDSLTINSSRKDFLIEDGPWRGNSLYELYKAAYTPYEWHEKLFSHAHEKGVLIFSTPFDEYAVDFLDELGAPAFKIASFEAIDTPLIAYVAKKRKPMIISTGLANLAEIESAVHTAKDNGCEQLVLLHCISSYPAPTEQANLKTMQHMARAFNVVPGLSDHTLGTATSVAAIALGGAVIEKHFTLSRDEIGPDSAFSLEPDEFKRLCNDCLDAWRSLGEISYRIKDSERENLKFRRSIYAVKDIMRGEEFTKENIRSIRPGYGLKPSVFPEILGKKSNVNIKRGEPLDWSKIKI